VRGRRMCSCGALGWLVVGAGLDDPCWDALKDA
jgi:hypothetical protein